MYVPVGLPNGRRHAPRSTHTLASIRGVEWGEDGQLLVVDEAVT